MKMSVVEIASNLMVKNDALAAKLRERFAERGTLVVNILSSPGSGKTTLLEETLSRLRANTASARSSVTRLLRTTQSAFRAAEFPCTK